MRSSATMPRAGRLDCVCEPGEIGRHETERRGVAPLAIGFAFSILAQVLTLAILPLAGLALAPSQGLATLPYAAFFAGAALASLPASLLLDSFGRRAAFSLGASLGAAGGMILAWALLTMHYGALALGAFWLGIASGFSLFYRHAAIPVGGKGAGALLIVFGAATLASLTSPTISAVAESLATPHAFVGTAVAAALAHIASLASTAALPYQRPRHGRDEPTGLQGWRRIVLPTFIGALGWFAMAALMGATPLAVIGCAPSEAAIGAVAWHVMAMYAPSLALAVFPKAAQSAPLTLGGGFLLVAAVLAFMTSSTATGFFIAAALLGVGWSLVMLGTTLWIHRDGPVSRWLLGVHDGTLLVSAILGAVAASAFV